MNDVQESKRPPSKPSSRRLGSIDWRLVFRYSGRLALMLGVGGLAAWTLATFSAWRGGDVARRGAAALDGKVAAASQESIESPTFLADFQDGQWSFPGSARKVSVARLTNGELEGRLAMPPWPPESPTQSATAIWREAQATAEPGGDDGDRRILAWLHSLKIKPARVGGWDVFRQDFVKLKIAAFVFASSSTERVDALRIASSDDGRQWEMIESLPSVSKARQGNQEIDLPIPSFAQIIGVRYDARGKPLGAIMSYVGESSRLAPFWEQHGWRVVDLSPATSDSRRVRCERDGQAWHAWINHAKQGSGTILIVREPAP